MMQDVAASIHQRLLNHARTRGRPFNQVLQYFALERFLHRLGRSPCCDQFVLKGALMFAVWGAPLSRPTRDIDLLGHMDNAVEHIVSAIQVVCRVSAPDDGLRFDDESVSGERIVEGADYEGVRIRFVAHLGKARVPMQVDVGFGDSVVPGPVDVQVPTILDLPPADLKGYSRESVIAEKLQAMVVLGALNSRMKDLHDIWSLASQSEFDGAILQSAIGETFRQRRTAVLSRPVAFEQAFVQDSEKQSQWRAFLYRQQIQNAPAGLDETVQLIADLVQPVLGALATNRPFSGRWLPGGPWRQEPTAGR